MFRSLGIGVLIFHCVVKLNAQNLVPDGSFEEIECPDNSINSFSDSGEWYATGADAYYLHDSCLPDPDATQSIVAIKSEINAYRGFGYMSLESLLTTNGYYIGEGVGTKLTGPLEQEQFYYLEMATMYYEDVIDPGHEGESCDPSPSRFISVHLAEDKIQLENNTTQVRDGFLITGINSNGKLRLTDPSPNSNNFRLNQWNVFWDCFQAEGGEEHIALVGSNGKVDPLIKCMDPNQVGNLYYTGYAVDNIQLLKIPERIDTIIATCPGSITVELKDIVADPFFEKAEFLWEDGSEEIVRTIDEARDYLVEMILPCVTVPIRIKLEEVSCAADVYIANIFSPNTDGINDELQVEFYSYLPVSSFDFRVYDRFGGLVFQTSSPDLEWNGTFKGQTSSPGVYAWQLEYALEVDNKIIRAFGEITLIR